MINWSQDTSIFKHGQKYLVCTSILFDEYVVATYYAHEDVTLEEFEDSGLYAFDYDSYMVRKISWYNIECWCEINNPQYI